MGHGIAQVFALAGYPVFLADRSRELAAAGLDHIKKNLDRSVQKGKLARSEFDAVLSRIKLADRLTTLSTADLVVEAVAESLEIKGKLFQELERICPPDTIFASNTSSLPITKLAQFTERPAQFVGMHFMNPPPVMKLVEVIRGKLTSDATVQVILELCRQLGKTPVEANDLPGFIANRILMPMINEAILAYEQGVGDKEAIDTVMKIGMGHPMGPLELADFIGLDVCLAILDVLYEGFVQPKYQAAPLLRDLVGKGHLGRKTGQGFYTYK